MKLIVGLGNPGKEYENTRHNIGFMCLDELSKHYSVEFSKNKFNGKYCDFTFNGEKIILLKPGKYMNLSGEVVSDFVNFFNNDINDILIICDDLDTNVGTYRLRYKGSSGGHNGLKNIEKHLGTNEYKRLKIGISNDKNIDTKDYVLGKFSNQDKEIIDSIIKIVPSIVDDFTKISFDKLMNKYHQK